MAVNIVLAHLHTHKHTYTHTHMWLYYTSVSAIGRSGGGGRVKRLWQLVYVVADHT